jgi:cytochrome P450
MNISDCNTTIKIPPHVPQSMVLDYDYFDMGGLTDVYAHFKKLHQGPDIFYTPQNDGHWVLTRYEDMEAVLLNARDFSSRHQTLPKKPFQVPLLEYDGELHSSFRRLLMPFFSNRKLQELEGVARNLANDLIDDFYDKGECDFVAAFAQKMPILIIMRLLGLPDKDIPYLLEISQAIIHNNDPTIQSEGFDRLFHYIAQDVLPKRRQQPGDDIFSALIQGNVDGGRALTDEELMGMGSLLIAAGLDTVVAMLSFFTLYLAENPAHRQQLIDAPELINDAMEELLRRHHLAVSSRVATADLDIRGAQLKKGDLILLPLPAAGLDERRYAEPEKVDFFRQDKKHMVFAKGPHMCIGAFLARTELRVFLQEWLKRIPHFEIKEGETPVTKTGTSVSVAYLPIRWST